ncbi:tetratricopeptide repeat protein [Streptomyces sp. NPDC001759]
MVGGAVVAGQFTHRCVQSQFQGRRRVQGAASVGWADPAQVVPAAVRGRRCDPGDLQQTVAAFERALALEPANWSLYLDLADVRAEQSDFTSAVRLIDQGMRYEPTELSLRAAGAAYRARLTGSCADLSELIELAPNLPNNSYRDLLIDHACAGPALPAELVAAARRIQHN